MFTTPRYTRLIFIALAFWITMNNLQSAQFTYSLYLQSLDPAYLDAYKMHLVSQTLGWTLTGSFVVWLFMPQRLK